MNNYYDETADPPTSTSAVWGEAYLDSFYVDSDLDGFGDPATGEFLCSVDKGGLVNNNWDMDDSVKCGEPAVDC